MQVHNNEITISRNESFTMNKVIRNRDGSPYIISREFSNPYFLISVSSSRYAQKDRYVYNKWLSLKDSLRFTQTKPVNIKDLGYESFNGLSIPHGYEGLLDWVGYATVAVFTDGKEYKYWKGSTDSGNWENYECTIRTTFTSEVTSKWPEQNYFYTILLVNGEDIEDHLTQLAVSSNVSVNTDDYRKLYEAIKAKDPTLVNHIENLDRPIVAFEDVKDILPPTKLCVRSNTKGAMI